MSIFEKTLVRVEDILHIGGCLCLLAVAGIINADIILRMLFNEPVQIQFELTELYLMPAVAMLSLSRIFRDGGHLALEFVPEYLPGALGIVIAKLRLLLPAVFFATVTFMSGKFCLRAFVHGDIEYGVINWPLGWAYAVVPLGCGVLTLRLFYDAFTKRESVQTNI